MKRIRTPSPADERWEVIAHLALPKGHPTPDTIEVIERYPTQLAAERAAATLRRTYTLPLSVRPRPPEYTREPAQHAGRSHRAPRR